jgi:VanZ family protein
MNSVKQYIPALIFTLLIPLLSLVDPEYLPDSGSLTFAGADKAAHLCIYALLTLSWSLALPPKLRTRPRHLLMLAAVVALYGLLMEIMQLCFTDTRSMEIWDMVANLSGTLIAAAAIFLLAWFNPCKKRE